MEGLLVLLDGNDITASLDGQSVKIQRPGAKTRHVPLGLARKFVVYGNPHVHCNVWRALAERNIPAVLLPARGKGDPVWIGMGPSARSLARFSQFRGYESPDIRNAVARWVVRRKIEAHLSLMDTFVCFSDHVHTVRLFGAELKTEFLSGKIEKTRRVMSDCLRAAQTGGGANTLMGHEGVAASAWFGFLRDILPEKWRFAGRNRRPPKDPVNALLSLTYTLAMSEMENAVGESGLDPGIGFLHALEPGRPSLVLDLLEPLRPCADAFVLSLPGNTLSPDHFTSSPHEGCRLGKEGRGLFYQQWAEWRNEWPVDLMGYTTEHKPAGSEKDDLPPESGKTLRQCCRRLVKEARNLWEGLPSGGTDG